MCSHHVPNIFSYVPNDVPQSPNEFPIMFPRFPIAPRYIPYPLPKVFPFSQSQRGDTSCSHRKFKLLIWGASQVLVFLDDGPIKMTHCAKKKREGELRKPSKLSKLAKNLWLESPTTRARGESRVASSLFFRNVKDEKIAVILHSR